MKVALFDIDGTLINTDGVGSRAFSGALEAVLGIRDGLREIRLHGQTDFLILEMALSKAGRTPQIDPETSSELYRCYVELLEKELEKYPAGYVVLPGVRAILDALQSRPGEFAVGLATGNLELGAWAKLRPSGLDRYFGFGGFGSDSRERSELIRRAVERAEERAGRKASQVFVIGDTPQDILHARKAGAKVVAVATGGHSYEELEQHAPDLLVEALEPIDPVLNFLNEST